MKAIVFSAYGSSEQLRLEEVAKPAPQRCTNVPARSWPRCRKILTRPDDWLPGHRHCKRGIHNVSVHRPLSR